MVSAWPEPPSAMSAAKSVGVRDGMEELAFAGIERQPHRYFGTPARTCFAPGFLHSRGFRLIPPTTIIGPIAVIGPSIAVVATAIVIAHGFNWRVASRFADLCNHPIRLMKRDERWRHNHNSTM
jgi:hypothetical protein